EYFWMSDSDACSSIDSHEGVLFLRIAVMRSCRPGEGSYVGCFSGQVPLSPESLLYICLANSCSILMLNSQSLQHCFETMSPSVLPEAPRSAPSCNFRPSALVGQQLPYQLNGLVDG